MVDTIYGTTAIPGDVITLQSGGAVVVGPEADYSLGLIGGMNVDTGTATPGEVKIVESAQDASELFGDDSELHVQTKLALQNGVSFVYAVGVSETETTDSFVGVSSGTLDNAPIFDPRVNYEHTVTEDGGNDVNVVDGTPTTPGDADTININCKTGVWEADASGTYDITYTYGDYSTAIDAMAVVDPTMTVVLTENASVINELITSVETEDNQFEFTIGVAGVESGVNTSTYTDSIDSFRMVLVSSGRGYVNDALTKQARTTGAVGALMASRPLGVSTTYKPLQGFTGLVDTFTPTQAGEMADAGVTPLMNRGGIKVIKDVTTSTDVRFSRAYAVRVADQVSRVSHVIAEGFVGEQNNPDERALAQQSWRRSLNDMKTRRPQLLAAYSLSLKQSDVDENTVDVTIGVKITPTMDTINIKLTVGDVITNGGLN